MSDPTPEPTPTEPTPAAIPKPSSSGTTPPWGSSEDFNPEKAWNLIQNLRTDLATTKSERDSARLEAAKVEKLAVEAQESKDAASAAELARHRSDVARRFRLDDDKFEFLSELTDPAQIEARAEKLAALTATPAPAVDPAQGSAPDKPSSTGEQFAEFFTQQLGG